MEKKQAQEYFDNIMDKFKKNSNDDSLSKEERLLLKNIVALSSNIEKISDDIENIDKERESKSKDIVFMEGKIQGLVEALLIQIKTISI